MSYFHVIAKLGSSKDQSCLFFDLSSDELRSKFLRPYSKGQDIFSGNNVIRVSELSSVQIVATQRTSEIERGAIQKKSWAEIDEVNRQSNSAVLISVGRGYAPEDIAEGGVDVTADYIKGPPSHAKGNLASSFGKGLLPWVITIVGGLTVAGIAKWLGWV